MTGRTRGHAAATRSGRRAARTPGPAASRRAMRRSTTVRHRGAPRHRRPDSRTAGSRPPDPRSPRRPTPARPTPPRATPARSPFRTGRAARTSRRSPRRPSRSTAPPPAPRRTPTIIAAAAVTALVLGAVAVVVPTLLDDDDRAVARRPARPRRQPGGGRDAGRPPPSACPRACWTGRLAARWASDAQVLDAATAAWKAKAPAAEAPTTAVGMLYAGELDGRHVALVQALDKYGKPRVAQLSGYPPTAYRLVHAEPLMGSGGAAVVPAAGRPGRAAAGPRLPGGPGRERPARQRRQQGAAEQGAAEPATASATSCRPRRASRPAAGSC